MPTKNLLKIRGARLHNLRNIDLDVPKNAMVVFTGVSGSGKSSLVFDTIYAEGQRRYVESLSAYARQFLGVMEKPDVDSIDGISPAIAIDQKSISANPRSTVGTITEIYDYLRLLFARVGVPYCPNGHGAITRQSAAQIKQHVMKMQGEIYILAPLVQGKKGEHRAILDEVAQGGFVRVRFDKNFYTMDEMAAVTIDPQKKHSIDVVVDHITLSNDEKIDSVRLSDSIETALKIGKGIMNIAVKDSKTDPPSHKATAWQDPPSSHYSGTMAWQDIPFSEHFACAVCGFSFAEVEPRTFSFNSPYGACQTCSGLGSQMEADPALIIPNKRLSLAEGAVKPWMNASHRVGRQGWYWYLLKNMSEKCNFSLTVPVKDLPKEAIDIILNGDDELEGVVTNLQRRYRETDSEWTRSEIEKYMNIRVCPTCKGRRLNATALAVVIGGKNIDDIVQTAIGNLAEIFSDPASPSSFLHELGMEQQKIVKPVAKEIASRLHFLNQVGLSYLTLARGSASLSGGEAQRIRLATQLGSYLSGVLYILDEPSIGLHERDQERLIKTMKELRDMGNSVLVIEHDPLTIRESDYVVDIGPGAGKYGGKVLFSGTPKALEKSQTTTGEYISGRKHVHRLKGSHAQKASKFIVVKGATEHNLKNIDARFPLEMMVCVTGVSGSGKSTLVNDILAKVLLKELHGAHTVPGEHKTIQGISHINKAIVVDQSPIGRTPRSNPATYTGAFTVIREMFAKTREARVRGYNAGRFSFNVKGGRCEACQGAGVKKVEMFFLPDVYVECDECKGKRYTKEALEIEYHGKTISDILEMTVTEALAFFSQVPMLANKLEVLQKVGLGYIELGQAAPSLSGGEAQRVKLATELSRRDTGRTLYILDEPTTGLHFDDIQNLLNVLDELVVKKNTVILIEHNMDMIRNADWIIDLGPEGGDGGGTIVAEGTPEEVKKVKEGYTSKYL